MGQQTPSAVVATTLNLQGKVDPPHLQDAGRGDHRRGTPTEVLPISPLHRSQNVRHRGRKSGHRPLLPQPPHTLPHLQDVHCFQAEEFNPQRRLLHLHRHLRRLPPHPHPYTLPEVPCLHSRRQAILLPSHAIRDKHRPPHFLPDRDRGCQVPPQHRYLSLGLHRRLAPVEQISGSPYPPDFNHSQLPSEVGLHPQPKEIPSGTFPDHHLPGNLMVRHQSHSSPKQQSFGEGPRNGPRIPPATLPLLEEIPKTPGVNKFRGTIHQVRAPSPQANHPDLPQLQGQEFPTTIAAVPTTPPMVDPNTELGSPSSNVYPTSQSHDLDRRLENRVGGGIFSGIHCQRRLVPRGEPPPHKHPGMSSCDSFPPLTKSPTGIRSSDKDRQHRCSVSYQQTGVQQEQDLVSLSPRASSTVRSEQLDNPIEASTRAPQHMGRLTISKSPSEGGVVSISTELPDAEDSPKSGDRSLRPPRKRPTADLRVSIPVPLSHSGRRPSRELEQVEENLPLPPSRSDSGLPPKASRIQRLRAGHRPSAPFRSLVARVPSRLHPNRRRPRRWAMGARRMAESHRENLLSLSRFQFLQNLYSRKYEAPVALALSNAHRGSTRDQYEHCWKDFQRWLSSNPSKPITKGSVLLYLTELAQTRGLSPKTVLVYRNALKLPLLHGFNINTSDREFSLLARSQFLQNPPPKKLIPAWNPNKVLSMLEQPEFLNHRATPHRLLMKTLFLVALATGNRVSEIAAFTRVGSKILPGSKKAIIAVRPGFLYKNQTLDRSPPNIVIKALLDQNLSPNRLCPVDSLRCWLALSDTWGVDAIFVNPKSHKKMNRGAVSQLLVTTINRSQPGVLAKAHDVRKVSATFAWARGVPPHQIIQTMFWKSTSVFLDKYLVPLQTDQ